MKSRHDKTKILVAGRVTLFTKYSVFICMHILKVNLVDGRHNKQYEYGKIRVSLFFPKIVISPAVCHLNVVANIKTCKLNFVM